MLLYLKKCGEVQGGEIENVWAW